MHRAGHDYLKTMCGDASHAVVADVESLPSRLPTLYRWLRFEQPPHGDRAVTSSAYPWHACRRGGRPPATVARRKSSGPGTRRLLQPGAPLPHIDGINHHDRDRYRDLDSVGAGG